jgi:nucleotide-binding universal stress UspA family protein
MSELRCVVAATDLSAPARRAVDRAARLARSASASLTLVHAVSGSALDELRRWLDTSGGTEETLLDAVRRRLRDLASELSVQYQVSVDDVIVTGRPVDEIDRIARERQADLIVTGTLGSGFLRNRFVGSTAERVVRKSSQPVLMVRQAPRGPYRRVLVPVDFSGWSGPSVEIAATVAPDAHFVLMHAVEAPFEDRLGLAGIDGRVVDEYRATMRSDALRRMRDLATRAGFESDRWTALTTQGGDVWVRIIQQEQEQDCDLIVVGKHGRNAMEDALLGSTTNRVMGESASDVLVCAQRDP